MNSFDKNAVSGVVETILFVVIGLLAVIAINNWYQTYTSDMATDVESSVSKNSVRILSLESNQVLIKNTNNFDLNLLEIRINSITCNFVIEPLSKNSITSINLGTCLENETQGVKEVIIITNEGIFSENKVFS